jgi:hypothetical protein
MAPTRLASCRYPSMRAGVRTARAKKPRSMSKTCSMQRNASGSVLRMVMHAAVRLMTSFLVCRSSQASLSQGGSTAAHYDFGRARRCTVSFRDSSIPFATETAPANEVLA